MLLSKALRITDSVTESVVSHLPGPLASPVTLAVAAATWAPRQVVGLHSGGQAEERPDHARPEERPSSAPASGSAGPAAAEPEVVLSLDRPAEHLEPPVDVVGEALQAEAAEVPPAHADADHVEVEEAVVFSTSSDDVR